MLAKACIAKLANPPLQKALGGASPLPIGGGEEALLIK